MEPATNRTVAMNEENWMPKKTVEFDAHKTVKKPTKVAFETKAGEEVKFVAEKPKRVPVRVKFKAKKPS